jgi:hypothetical protein
MSLIVSGVKSLKYNVDNNGLNFPDAFVPSQSQNNVRSSWAWTTTIDTADGGWRGVCWSPELRLFCAVGSGGSGSVMTSTNGTTWISRTRPNSPTAFACETVCWSPQLGLFCVVANATADNLTTFNIATSPNGINWTVRTNPNTAVQLFSVCWSPELSLFCAVGNSGSGQMAVYSSDGITWTSSSGFTTTGWRSICWSPELGIFCCTGTSTVSAISTNGRTWVLSATVIGGRNFLSVCWSPVLRLFCTLSSTSSSRVVTSVNGLVWTDQVYPGSPSENDWRCICWSTELGAFYALAGTGTANRFMTSFDGVTWTRRTILTDLSWRSICWAPELNMMCAVNDTTGTANVGISVGIPIGTTVKNELTGSNINTNSLNLCTGRGIQTTTNTINSQYSTTHTWTTRALATGFYTSVCWSPELSLFVATRGTGGVISYSETGGVTWTNFSTGSDVWNSVCWAPDIGTFCAVGTSGSVATSTNGTSWTLQTAANSNDWVSVCWSPELLLLCAVSSTASASSAMTSPNGVTWTARTTPSAPDAGYNSVCWSSELRLFCAVGRVTANITRQIMTSANGILWGPITSLSATDLWSSVCWSPELGLFCAVALGGGTNIVMTSPNGSTWTAQTPAIVTGWGTVCWSAELGLFTSLSIFSPGTQVMTSPNGVNWTGRSTSYATNRWVGVCWSPQLRRFCGVTDEATANAAVTSDATFNVAFTDSFTKTTSMTVGTGGVNITNAGTVSAPSLYLSTDTGSGVYRPAANQVAVAVSGVQAMNITSSGTTVAGLKVGSSGTTYAQFLSGSFSIGALLPQAGITSGTITFSNAFASAPTVLAQVCSTSTVQPFQNFLLCSTFSVSTASCIINVVNTHTVSTATTGAVITWFAFA